MYCDTSRLVALPPLLSSAELCAALHISKQTAIGLIRSGLLPITVEQRHNCPPAASGTAPRVTACLYRNALQWRFQALPAQGSRTAAGAV